MNGTSVVLLLLQLLKLVPQKKKRKKEASSDNVTRCSKAIARLVHCVNTQSSRNRMLKKNTNKNRQHPILTKHWNALLAYEILLQSLKWSIMSHAKLLHIKQVLKDSVRNKGEYMTGNLCCHYTNIQSYCSSHLDHCLLLSLPAHSVIEKTKGII